eukprot:1714954-Amphidinium_carterae.1
MEHGISPILLQRSTKENQSTDKDDNQIETKQTQRALRSIKRLRTPSNAQYMSQVPKAIQVDATLEVS